MGAGLTPAGRRRREAVRLQAAELFEQKIKPLEVARRLRVSRKSAYEWQQLWRDGGREALASRGPRLLIFLGAILEDTTVQERQLFLTQMPAPARLLWHTLGTRLYKRTTTRVRRSATAIPRA
ncbi:helix-turn-helix domain-containing protein [Streptomyces sp. NPDC058291]|jgi:hypothetical protein|uniref:helix-turn-helix domain-containing protein n=1 Tax=Streptomyces sp. NPDC058291 TaxID=3346427 RepID=UPI0036ECC2CE